MKKERLFYLDFVRSLSIILIVIFHFNCSMNAEASLANGMLMVVYNNGELGQIGVALFLIISGASLMYVYDAQLSLGDYFKKRLYKIYPMFYIAYASMFLLVFFIDKTIRHGVEKWTFILTILGMDGYLNSIWPNYFLVGEWFIGCIILLYLCFPLLRKMLIDKPKSLMIITFIFYVIIVETYNYSMRIDWNFITRIPDFLVGMYFVKYIKKAKLYQFLIALSISTIMFFIPLNINPMYKVTLMGISLFVALVYLSQVISNEQIKKIFEVISKYSYAIFLVHHVIILQVVRHFKGQTLTNSEVFCVFLISSIIILVVSIFIDKLTTSLMRYLHNIKFNKIK